MSDVLTVAIIYGVAVGAIAVGSLAFLRSMAAVANETNREAMRTLSDLFRQHTTSLENLKAIESGPDGMRGVVARTRPAPSLLEDPPEPEAPPDSTPMTAYTDVGHDTSYTDVGHDSAVAAYVPRPST
jgi:hypothetical protein